MALNITVPGFRKLNLEHFVFDYNGTLAFDGKLADSTKERLVALSEFGEVHVITADTFGSVVAETAGLPVTVQTISQDYGCFDKERIVANLGSEKVVAFGNGRNDGLMLKKAILGIAVIEREGAASISLTNADLIIGNIDDAIDLLLNPKRLIASLRL